MIFYKFKLSKICNDKMLNLLKKLRLLHILAKNMRQQMFKNGWEEQKTLLGNVKIGR